jgi:hypothetical protein
MFPWRLNLEYGGTFTKLFMHVSSRNMFPTTRNLQIRVHVYCPCHCCGYWLTYDCFVPMIADHDLVKKADFRSKSQNIWQQIILLSRTVMQMICAWPKIWTLSGRLSLMRNVQLMKTKIFRVYHIRIIAKKNWFTPHETDRFLNTYCQECVRAYLSIHDCLSFLHEVMIGNHRNKTIVS